MKVLFQGDSITDACRHREDYHHLGDGYPKYAAALLKERHPEIDFEFINLGKSGNKTDDLIARLQTDFIDIQPDIVSVLIGINDIWDHVPNKDWLPDEVFEEKYRTILEAIKTKTNAKIMMLEPFIIPVEDKLVFREDLGPKIQVIRKLAREYVAVYMPTDGLLASAFIGNDPLSFAEDGIHPTVKGAQAIGEWYADYFEKML